MSMETEEATLRPVAHIRTDFPSKFGIPRQSGLCGELAGRIVLMPEYRQREALRCLEEFSHLWLIWQFSACVGKPWHATVRPPRLGGNRRVGVFASRSPFRPNNMGLSCVRLCGIDYDCPEAPVILVSGVDMLDNTPIFDIKPYIPVSDCVPDANPGYTAITVQHRLSVNFPEELLSRIPEEKRKPLLEVLAEDPRPGYEDDPEKEHGFGFAGRNIIFYVSDGVLRVSDVD